MDGDNLFARVLEDKTEDTMLSVAVGMIREGLGERGAEFFREMKYDDARVRSHVVSSLRYLDVTGAQISFCLSPQFRQNFNPQFLHLNTFLLLILLHMPHCIIYSP